MRTANWMGCLLALALVSPAWALDDDGEEDREETEERREEKEEQRREEQERKREQEEARREEERAGEHVRRAAEEAKRAAQIMEKEIRENIDKILAEARENAARMLAESREHASRMIQEAEKQVERVLKEDKVKIKESKKDVERDQFLFRKPMPEDAWRQTLEGWGRRKFFHEPRERFWPEGSEGEERIDRFGPRPGWKAPRFEYEIEPGRARPLPDPAMIEDLRREVRDLAREIDHIEGLIEELHRALGERRDVKKVPPKKVPREEEESGKRVLRKILEGAPSREGVLPPRPPVPAPAPPPEREV